jgi:hypothetical protein
VATKRQDTARTFTELSDVPRKSLSRYGVLQRYDPWCNSGLPNGARPGEKVIETECMHGYLGTSDSSIARPCRC